MYLFYFSFNLLNYCSRSCTMNNKIKTTNSQTIQFMILMLQNYITDFETEKYLTVQK